MKLNHPRKKNTDCDIRGSQGIMKALLPLLIAYSLTPKHQGSQRTSYISEIFQNKIPRSKQANSEGNAKKEERKP